MFRVLSEVISRIWILVLAIWIGAFVVLRWIAPPFEDLAKGGEFVFLPDSSASRKAESEMNKAFPGHENSSNIVVLAYRDDGTLTDDDRDFITNSLKPALDTIRDKSNQTIRSISGGQKTTENKQQIVTEIRTFADPGIGALLVSNDQKASLVDMELAMDFQDMRNWTIVDSVEKVIDDLQKSSQMPKGLKLALTGSATLGRDRTQAESNSADNTIKFTILFVVILLVIIYRAPLLALVPLLTLFMAVDVSLHLLTVLGQKGYVPLFMGLQEYTTVLTYGPGIDYCLFLIARYKENLENCVPSKQALKLALGQVGSAITASAATVICGIGMMSFAQFGKFHDAGIGISIALLITMVATLTLTPSLLFLTGHWVFWPKRGVHCEPKSDDPNAKQESIVQTNMFQPVWIYMGGLIERHPLPLLLGTFGVMVPFVIFGVLIFGNVNYGLLESLPKSATSVASANLLQEHFPTGITGPVDVLLNDPSVDFRTDDGITLVKNLVDQIMKQSQDLKVDDVRSVADPLGRKIKLAEGAADESIIKRVAEKREIQRRGVEHYVSSAPGVDGHATQLEFVMARNPFSIETVGDLGHLDTVIRSAWPKDKVAKMTVSFAGPTASVRDLNLVSQSDQQHIFLLVTACVLVILMVLLRSIVVSIYLILTVLLSYLATLGITWLLFYSLDPRGFPGLDWTVALFLFVVLIAVGEDYNIFLVTRIREEQARNGPTHGISVALSLTGGIITSCGFIMAGTFASLSTGSLVRMHQLAFALAFGVLLDTFVIRPILVPAFLMVINDKRYGNLSKYFV